MAGVPDSRLECPWRDNVRLQCNIVPAYKFAGIGKEKVYYGRIFKDADSSDAMH